MPGLTREGNICCGEDFKNSKTTVKETPGIVTFSSVPEKTPHFFTNLLA
jgi:hypothetical protein